MSGSRGIPTLPCAQINLAPLVQPGLHGSDCSSAREPITEQGEGEGDSKAMTTSIRHNKACSLDLWIQADAELPFDAAELLALNYFITKEDVSALLPTGFGKSRLAMSYVQTHLIDKH